MTYNGELFILYPFGTDFSCSVKADDLLKILTTISTEELEMYVEEDNLWIVWKGGKFYLSIYMLDDHKEIRDDMLANITDATKDGWYQLPKDFVEGARLCSFSASKDRSGGAQNTFYAMRVEGEDLFCLDNLRGSWFEMEFEMGNYLIDSRHVVELVKYPLESYCDTETWIHFKTKDEVIISAALVQGQYPDPRDYFDFQGVSIELPLELKEVLTNLLTVSAGDMDIDKRVDITVEGGKITCSAKKQTGGGERYLEEIPYEGEPFTFAINPVFLSDILDKTNEMVINEDLLRAGFVHKNFHHLIMLKVRYPEKQQQEDEE